MKWWESAVEKRVAAMARGIRLAGDKALLLGFGEGGGSGCCSGLSRGFYSGRGGWMDGQPDQRLDISLPEIFFLGTGI
jgi:hypothetical protein